MTTFFSGNMAVLKKIAVIYRQIKQIPNDYIRAYRLIIWHEWILFYVGFCKIMTISRQKEARQHSDTVPLRFEPQPDLMRHRGRPIIIWHGLEEMSLLTRVRPETGLHSSAGIPSCSPIYVFTYQTLSKLQRVHNLLPMIYGLIDI